jgi:raffinose/stachyose/melibiose transport system substrate-binding protein
LLDDEENAMTTHRSLRPAPAGAHRGPFSPRSLSRIALVGAAALTLAGCSAGAQPGGGGGEGGASAWTLTGGAEETFRSSFQAWNDANGDSPITAEYFANDAFKEKIRTSVGSGNAPTLIYNWGGDTLESYVENGSVVELTGEIPEMEERALDSVLETGKVDGKLYAVPNNNTQPVILYYNTKLFEEAGVEVPTTWEEMLDAVEAFKAEGVTPISVAGSSQWPYLMWIQYLTDRIGGPEVFQAVVDGEEDAWSHPAITEALEKIQELVEAGGFGDAYGSVVADAGADVALVHTDQAAMMLHGSWVYSSFLTDAPEWTAEGNLGYTTFPEIEGGQGDPQNIVGNPANFWAVSADASEEEQATALEYLNDMNLDDAAVDTLFDAGLIPAVDGVEDRIAETEHPEYLDFAYSMVQDAPNFQLSWDQALPADQGQALLTNLSQVFAGEMSPEEFQTAMNGTL